MQGEEPCLFMSGPRQGQASLSFLPASEGYFRACPRTFFFSGTLAVLLGAMSEVSLQGDVLVGELFVVA